MSLMLMQTPVPPIPPPDLPSAGFLLVALLGSLPILGVMVWGAVKILGPIGQALARRIGAGGAEDEVQQALAEVQRELHEVRAELTETQERLDFAERMLTSRREADRLPG